MIYYFNLQESSVTYGLPFGSRLFFSGLFNTAMNKTRILSEEPVNSTQYET